MHDGVLYDPIQAQGHEPFKVGNPAIFNSYLQFAKWGKVCHLQLHLVCKWVFVSRGQCFVWGHLGFGARGTRRHRFIDPPWPPVSGSPFGDRCWLCGCVGYRRRCTRFTRRSVSSRRNFVSSRTHCAGCSRRALRSSRTSPSRRRRCRSTRRSAWACARRCRWTPRSALYSSFHRSCASSSQPVPACRLWARHVSSDSLAHFLFSVCPISFEATYRFRLFTPEFFFCRVIFWTSCQYTGLRRMECPPFRQLLFVVTHIHLLFPNLFRSLLISFTSIFFPVQWSLAICFGLPSWIVHYQLFTSFIIIFVIICKPRRNRDVPSHTFITSQLLFFVTLTLALISDLRQHHWLCQYYLK